MTALPTQPMLLPPAPAVHAADDIPSATLATDPELVHCRRCEAPHVLTTMRVESIHRSAEGMVGYLRCAAGHLVVHQFAAAYPKPKPPRSVVALRAELAAIERPGTRRPS